MCSIYIWETKSDTGHAALELPDGNYLSLRPSPPWVGNIFFPVPATNASFQGDVAVEGRRPDRTIPLSLNKRQIDVITGEVEKQKTAFQKRNTLYHLFPKCNLLSLFRKSGLNAFAACPFSEVEMGDGRGEKLEQKARGITTSHYSLAVARALASVGINTPIGKTPWGITPTELGNSLDSVI